MSKTNIEWTDVTWNPSRGCSRVSEGCRNCYAERIAARFSNEGSVEAGEFVGFAERTPSGPRWTGKVELIESKLEEPLHWKKPRRVFVNSMSDLFHEALPDEAIDRVFAVMALCPQHTFQILTKRPERMREWVTAANVRLAYVTQRASIGWATSPDNPRRHPRLRFGDWRGQTVMEPPCILGFEQWPLPNVWLGVSVEDDSQQQRIRELVKTPAAVRFISYEPALGPLDVRWALTRRVVFDGLDEDEDGIFHGIDWIICGGESGPGARPFDIAWARSVRDQCSAAHVPFFMKQIGAYAILDLRYDRSIPGWTRRLRDKKGGDMEEWPSDLRIRQFPVAVK